MHATCKEKAVIKYTGSVSFSQSLIKIKCLQGFGEMDVGVKMQLLSALSKGERLQQLLLIKPDY